MTRESEGCGPTKSQQKLHDSYFYLSQRILQIFGNYLVDGHLWYYTKDTEGHFIVTFRVGNH